MEKAKSEQGAAVSPSKAIKIPIALWRELMQLKIKYGYGTLAEALPHVYTKK